MASEPISIKKQEEKIKNRLVNIQFQESQTPSYHFTRYYDLNTNIHKKHSQFPQLSEWASGFQLPRKDIKYMHKQKQHLSTAQKDRTRMTFFNTTRYPSSLLSPSNKKSSRLELSPIVVKFNAKVLSQNLQKSKQKYIKKLKEDPYMTRYQSSSLIQSHKKNGQLKTQKRPQVKQIKFQGDSQNQRMSGILKLLKKEVPFRSRPKRPTNPEAMYLTNRIF